jgi:serine/threonine-protein kinase
VLVSTKGIAKLIDFGIAKARDRLAGDTNTDQLKGKVQYMAPEQALGRGVDRRADVWAVGAVLYHLLAGKPPFEAENEVQTLFLLTSGRPAPPLRTSVHAAVAEVVRKALTHDVEARFATAAEMQAAIEAAMLEAGITTSTAAVADYLSTLVADRTERRKEAISLGLRAADERDKYADLMRVSADATGASQPGTRLQSAILGPSEPSSATGQTLGSASVDLPVRERGRGLRVAIFALAAAALVCTGAFLAVFGPGRVQVGTSSAAAPSEAPPPSAAVEMPASKPSSSASAAAADAGATAAEVAPTDAGAHTVSRPTWTPRWAPSPAPTSPPAASTPPPAVKTRINDGF